MQETALNEQDSAVMLVAVMSESPQAQAILRG